MKNPASEYNVYRHKRSALQSVAVRRSTGNDVSGHKKLLYFLFLFFRFFSCFFPPFFSIVTFSHRRSAGSENLFSESCLKWPITWGWTPLQTEQEWWVVKCLIQAQQRSFVSDPRPRLAHAPYTRECCCSI